MDFLKINSAIARLNSTPINGMSDRDKLILKARTLMLEYEGRAKNKALSAAGKPALDFGSTFKDNNSYEKALKKCNDDLLYMAAKTVNDVMGKKTDREDRRTFTNSKLANNGLYLQVLGDMMNEIMYPQTPYLVNELVGEMASVVTTERGKTYALEVKSNAVMQWYDSTWTSLRSVPSDKLYNRTITLNPKPVASRATINFYQMVGNNGNLIETMAALAGGYGAMIMDKFTKAFLAAADNERYVTAALKRTGYTGDNWAQLCQNVAKANRVRRDQLIGYGDFMALRKVLPADSGLGPGIMMQLGNEYFKNGYIMSHDGVMLYELTPTSTPETINTTLTSVFPEDTIVIAARANERYAPMVICFEDGGMGSVDLTPGDDVIGTGNIDVLQYTSLDIAPAFASRIGVMEDIA